MKEASFAELFEEAKKHDAYWVADVIYGFTKELHNLAETAKVSRTELARRLAVSPAYITKIFRGDVNFTIDTMVRLAHRVGARLHLHLVPEGFETYPFNWNSASIEWQKVTHAETAADNYGYANAVIEEKLEVEYELLAACG
jgi:transcriptional regulator with XRE-family HTH domain